MVAAGAATGVVVMGQARDVVPERVTVANRPTEPVPVTGIITRMPPVSLTPGVQVDLGPDTIAILKEERVVRIARVQWEYRELRVDTAPASYRSVMAPLAAAGAEGWETTGLSFSDAGATVMILKRPR